MMSGSAELRLVGRILNAALMTRQDFSGPDGKSCSVCRKLVHSAVCAGNGLVWSVYRWSSLNRLNATSWLLCPCADRFGPNDIRSLSRLTPPLLLKCTSIFQRGWNLAKSSSHWTNTYRYLSCNLWTLHFGWFRICSISPADMRQQCNFSKHSTWQGRKNNSIEAIKVFEMVEMFLMCLFT